MPPEEINQLKPLILNQYFDVVHLKCIKNTAGDIIGFSGVVKGMIEMLFVSKASQGKKVGSTLCQHALLHQSVTHVDVNEQNPRAIKFYEKMGFIVIGRSERDKQGKPYPILHMKYKRP